MKKLIATIMVIGFLFSGNYNYSKEITDPNAEKPSNNTKVLFKNVNSGAMLFVKDKNDRILYSESIQSDGNYSRNFDLSALPDKEYYFEVDKKGFIMVLPFTVKNETVEIHEDLKTMISKPLLYVEDEQVKLVRSIDKKHSLNVKIYNQYRQLVFDETINKDGMVGKIYDFSNNMSGNYQFVINFEDRRLSQTLNIQTFDN